MTKPKIQSILALKRRWAVFLQWYKLRKHSVIAHWFYGLFCAYIGMLYFPALLAMMGLFAVWEAWNDKCDGGHEGAMDWWDAFVTLVIGFTVILILDGISIVTIRWI